MTYVIFEGNNLGKNPKSITSYSTGKELADRENITGKTDNKVGRCSQKLSGRLDLKGLTSSN